MTHNKEDTDVTASGPSFVQLHQRVPLALLSTIDEDDITDPEWRV
ncbi:hypothetical protein CDAR_402631, partial [Caerostris darwini]